MSSAILSRRQFVTLTQRMGGYAEQLFINWNLNVANKTDK